MRLLENMKSPTPAMLAFMRQAATENRAVRDSYYWRASGVPMDVAKRFPQAQFKKLLAAKWMVETRPGEAVLTEAGRKWAK